MSTSFLDGRVVLHAGDCREVIRSLADNSVDSVVSDPPYALVSIVKRFGKPGAAAAKGGVYNRSAAGFMGKQWDNGEAAFAAEFWAEVYRVLKPGGHVLAFSGTRTYHRLACAIEDAGFEIRDQIGWLYGSGFPKSHDVSKGIDRVGGMPPSEQAALLTVKRESAGLSREEVAEKVGCTPSSVRDWEDGRARVSGGAIEHITPSKAYRAALAILLGYSEDERRLVGVATDRRDDGTVYGVGHTGNITTGGHTDLAAQWQGWGTALKPAWEPIVMARKPLIGTVVANVLEHGTGALNIDGCRVGDEERTYEPKGTSASAAMIRVPDHRNGKAGEKVTVAGRWPANLIHDGSDEVLAAFPTTDSGGYPPEGGQRSQGPTYGKPNERGEQRFTSSEGSAARFFYTAKADGEDRLGSKHPTVKPLDLMQYLVRLVTPPRVLYCPQCEAKRHGNSKESAGSGEGVRALPETVQTEGQSAHGTVLQPTVRGGSAGAKTSAVRMVRDDLPAEEGRGSPILHPDLRGEVEREEPGVLEGLRDEQGGLSAPLDARSSSVSLAERVHLRASLGDAAKDWSTADGGGSGSPHQWDQVGQPPGEPGVDVEGGSRQTQPAEAEHAVLPTLSWDDRHEPTCKDCGHRLEWRPGTVLDPFAGTGTTGEAAFREGMRAILIEREPEYQADIGRRMDLAEKPTKRAAVAKSKNNLQGAEGTPLFGDGK